MKYKNFLQNLPMFSKLSEQVLDIITKNVKEKKFNDGEKIFEERTEGEDIYVVYSGSVEIFKNYGGENEKLLSVLTTGSIFGETALFSKVLRTATAVAKGETLILCIQSSVFLEIFKTYPDEGIKIVQWMLFNTIARLEQTSKELATIYTISQKMVEAVKVMMNVKTFLKNISSEIEFILADRYDFGIYVFNRFNDEYELVSYSNKNSGFTFKEVYDKNDKIIKTILQDKEVVFDKNKIYTYVLSDIKNVYGFIMILTNIDEQLSQQNKDLLSSLSNLVSISTGSLFVLQEEKEKIRLTSSKTKYSF